MAYVTDTHPFLWHLSEDKRLGTAAKEVFKSAEKGDAIIIVPVIVLAESFYIAEKKDFKLEFSQIIKRVENSLNFPPFPLDIEIIKGISDLEDLPDLHDKIIVATAKMTKSILITKDKRIRDCGYVETIW